MTEPTSIQYTPALTSFARPATLRARHAVATTVDATMVRTTSAIRWRTPNMYRKVYMSSYVTCLAQGSEKDDQQEFK